MKTIYNDIIPFKGFTAINLFGVIFARKGEVISERTIRHESIHTAQMKELWYLPFYLWYLFEWLIKLFRYGRKSYNNISFEREAYMFEYYSNYVQTRKKFAFLKYL